MQVEMIDRHSASNFTLKKLDPHSRYRFYLRGRTAPGQGLPIIKEGATTLDGGLPLSLSPIYLMWSLDVVASNWLLRAF